MNRIRTTRALLIIALAAATTTACSYSPRNGDVLAHASTPITWAGGSGTPGQGFILTSGSPAVGSQYSLQGFIAGVTADTNAYVDGAGTKWYGFSRNDVVIPSGAWTKIATHTIQAKLSTIAIDGSGKVTTQLATFDAGSTTDSCLQSHQNDLVQATAACKSSKTPVVTITAPCGTMGEACCSNTCDSGLTCDTNRNTCLVSAGSTCALNGDCAFGNTCFAGTCVQFATAKFGTLSKNFLGDSTYAYTANTLGGAGSAVTFTPRQEVGQDLTVLDLPYDFSSGGQGDISSVGDLNGSHWSCLPTHFTTLNVAANQTLSTTLQKGVMTMGSGVDHVLRYAHGTCSKRIDWKNTVFETFSNIVKTTAEARLKANIPGILKPFTSFSLDWDTLQPQFRSDGTKTEWGFFYEGSFNINVLGTTTHMTISPGFSFSVGSDGLVDVASLTQGVVLIPDVANAKPQIQDALKYDAPAQIKSVIRGLLEMPVSSVLASAKLPVTGDLSCSSGAALSSQQDTCMSKAGPMFGGFQSALVKQNFACGSNNQCAIHPMVQAVNVMPTSVEVVLAPNFAGGADTLGPLYKGMGVCDAPQPQGVTSGYITTVWHGNNAFSTACGPILQ